MSRFLKMFILGGCVWGIFLVICLTNHWWIFTAVWLLLGGGVVANFALYKQLKQLVNQMNANGTIRNVDYLIIGESIDVHRVIDEKSTFFAILSPERSREASKEILKHTFSILKEAGTVILVDKEKNQKGYSCFDILWFHDITIKRLKLKKIFCKFPFFVKPIASLQILLQLNNASKKLEEIECPDEELKEFCGLRELNLKYYRVKR